MVREFHLFAGLGGGIYGGQLLGHSCVGGVEVDPFCQELLQQRQLDGWMNSFPIYSDIRLLSGKDFIGTFDVLCGGFPCQAFSHAARGKNIPTKNLWLEMLRFSLESEAPIIFGENVTLKAIKIATTELGGYGYKVRYCKLSCGDLGADHRRDRYWFLAHNNKEKLDLVDSVTNPIININCWTKPFVNEVNLTYSSTRRKQLKAIGNSQSPLVAACAFRVLVNRFRNSLGSPISVPPKELYRVFSPKISWIKSTFGDDFGYVHTPTTMANYSAPSMMKHLGCRNFVKVFNKPSPQNAEYLMGLPFGASSPSPMSIHIYNDWLKGVRDSW